jgi:hypothetical protein
MKQILTYIIYLLELGTNMPILVLYIDDLFLTSAEKLIARCEAGMAVEFETKDIGMMHYFLCLEVW